MAMPRCRHEARGPSSRSFGDEEAPTSAVTPSSNDDDPPDRRFAAPTGDPHEVGPRGEPLPSAVGPVPGEVVPARAESVVGKDRNPPPGDIEDLDAECHRP